MIGEAEVWCLTAIWFLLVVLYARCIERWRELGVGGYASKKGDVEGSGVLN